ncbi:hypothetical protein BDN71DRAFT_1447506 [Pleurotus eryngii]|uniref:Uncharacterized protein n=1 Tax=Pleurotus eryngii TaxID=5323 RepID=A0A9P5ZWU9_PLEER|nr:hypothetical protein BDN71DRAFT_1447506 [Pleurotus eryngii]
MALNVEPPARQGVGKHTHSPAPHLAECIRVLHLWWNRNHPDLCDRASNMDWFPSCFARLTNLQELYLEQWIGRWVMSPGAVSTLGAPLRMLVLRGWDFSGKGSDPLSMLAHTLEDLRLDNIVSEEIEFSAGAAPFGVAPKP